MKRNEHEKTWGLVRRKRRREGKKGKKEDQEDKTKMDMVVVEYEEVVVMKQNK